MKTSAMAPFERVAAAIRADISRGDLKPGDKLPPNRDIAASHGVAIATAQKALQLLHDAGWVTKRASVGTFVNTPPADGGTELDRIDRVEAKLAKLQERVEMLERANSGATPPPAE